MRSFTRENPFDQSDYLEGFQQKATHRKAIEEKKKKPDPIHIGPGCVCMPAVRQV